VILAQMTRHYLLVVCLLVAATAGHARDTLYKLEPGPFEVQVVEQITLTDPLRDRDVTFRVLHPKQGNDTAVAASSPVVVWSTGMFCWPQLYDGITGHWASHGYVVIEPNHPDSPNKTAPPSMEDLEIIVQTRVRDASFALDALDEIAAGADIGDTIDPGRIAIAGHSFGAVISMVKTGLTLKEEFRGDWGDTYDPRFQAAVLVSAPGPGMKEMAENAYDSLKKPMVSTGGTKDVGRVNPGDLSPGEWRSQAFLLAPPGDKYALILEGSDHYLGGLICNAERGGDADPGAVEIIRAVTLAFLDAYIRNDEDAMAFLKTADIPALTDERATWRSK